MGPRPGGSGPGRFGGPTWNPAGPSRGGPFQHVLVPGRPLTPRRAVPQFWSLVSRALGGSGSARRRVPGPAASVARPGTPLGSPKMGNVPKPSLESFTPGTPSIGADFCRTRWCGVPHARGTNGRDLSNSGPSPVLAPGPPILRSAPRCLGGGGLRPRLPGVLAPLGFLLVRAVCPGGRRGRTPWCRGLPQGLSCLRPCVLPPGGRRPRSRRPGTWALPGIHFRAASFSRRPSTSVAPPGGRGLFGILVRDREFSRVAADSGRAWPFIDVNSVGPQRCGDPPGVTITCWPRGSPLQARSFCHLMGFWGG